MIIHVTKHSGVISIADGAEHCKIHKERNADDSIKGPD